MTRSLDETANNRQTDTENKMNNSANDSRQILTNVYQIDYNDILGYLD